MVTLLGGHILSSIETGSPSLRSQAVKRSAGNSLQNIDPVVLYWDEPLCSGGIGGLKDLLKQERIMKSARIALLASGLLIASGAQADIVRVEILGSVDFNVIGGDHAGIPSGAPVMMAFDLDSDDFVDSGSFPTRGYSIILSSFVMTVGGAGITMDDPQPFGPAYFVLRDNDPAVDGFLISRNVDFPQPVGVHVNGLTQAHELDFLATYGNTTTLSSLNILDAVGSYDFTGISVFGWGVGRFGNHGAEYIYESMTITRVPAPASLALLGLGGFAIRRRR